MKKTIKFATISLIMAITLILTTSCNKEEEKVAKMTMTTAKEGLVRIALSGTGTAVINWGDGAPNETVTFTGSITRYSHTYAGTTAHTITIIGDDIMSFWCGSDPSYNGDIFNNQLISLDVNENSALTRLNCNYNELKNLDLSKNPALTDLYCDHNELKNLDLSKNPALTYLACNNNRLTTLDLSKNPVLTDLYCDDNELNNLDVSKNPALSILICGNNQLTAFDLSKNPVLIMLLCPNNELNNLDLSKNPALTRLDCYHNKLNNLNVSKNQALSILNCFNNQLTSLDLSKNPVLTLVNIMQNLFEAEIEGKGLNPLFRTLHSNIKEFKAIVIEWNPGTAACDPSIALAKGWSVL